MRVIATVVLAVATALSCTACEHPSSAPTGASVTGSVGSRVFVVEREERRLAVFDLDSRTVLPDRIEGFGDMRHATMTFSPDLRFGYVATRSGQLSRIDLATLERTGDVEVSNSSIDLAISQDGRYIATAEYTPGGVTILDARTMQVARRLSSGDSRVTGIVDAPGNLFVCVLMEREEVWVIDTNDEDFPIRHRIPVPGASPYDAMITPDGRFYVVGHLDSTDVSVVDLRHPEAGARVVSIADPESDADSEIPVKLPHMASWAAAGDHIFVPLVGQPRLAMLDRETFELRRSVEVRGNPVYAVSSPAGHEVWVSFSGAEDDAFVAVLDSETGVVKHEIEVGERIYHLDFTPRGAFVLVTANRANRLAMVDANSYEAVTSVELASPSGIFGVWRAFRIGL